MIAIGPSGSRRAELNDEQQSATERLLESSWAQRERRASRRELAVDATAAGLFVAAAGALAVAGDTAGLRPGIAALLIAIYAVVARIEFPVGAGYVVPTQLILVPMLLMLPPAVVPAAVGRRAGGGSARSTGRWAACRPAASCRRCPMPGMRSARRSYWCWRDRRSSTSTSCRCWSPRSPPGASSTWRARWCACAWRASCPSCSCRLKVIALVWAVDACLAPLGFLAAIATRQNDIAILFVLPLAFLLSLLARDRSQRINQAHRRLKLVEQERARLQTAVRRLGDAFAAKLELNGLLEILLHGSVEALDAAAGRLDLGDEPAALQLEAGAERWLDVLGRVIPRHDVTDSAGPGLVGGRLDPRHADPHRRLAP